MYWGSEEDEKQKKSNFQVTRKELKRRGRKKLNPSDVDTQRFQCFCTKQYRSYAALYGHVKIKHRDFFRQNKGFGGTNTVDTFDPNHGYKIRKVLMEKIQFSSDIQKAGPDSITNKSSSVPPPHFNLTPLPQFAPKAKVTRNFNHYLEEEQRALEYEPNKRQEETNYVPRPRPSPKSPHDLDFQEVHEKIRQTTSPSELMQLTKKTLEKIMKSEYVIDKFEEGKYYEIHQISRLAQKLEDMKKMEEYTRRKKHIVEEKMGKYQEIIYRQREIVDAYEKIILELKIEPITNALFGPRTGNEMEIQNQFEEEEEKEDEEEYEEEYQEEYEENEEQQEWDQEFQ